MDVWFRVDARPFKHALLNIVKRWSLMFKQHLIDHVTNSLSDLELFVKVRCCIHIILSLSLTLSLSLSLPLPLPQETKTGLSVMVEEGDYDGLVSIMLHLIKLKERQLTTDGMFEPLKQTIELLRTYDQEMSDDVHRQLEVQLNNY